MDYLRDSPLVFEAKDLGRQLGRSRATSDRGGDSVQSVCLPVVGRIGFCKTDADQRWGLRAVCAAAEEDASEKPIPNARGRLTRLRGN